MFVLYKYNYKYKLSCKQSDEHVCTIHQISKERLMMYLYTCRLKLVVVVAMSLFIFFSPLSQSLADEPLSSPLTHGNVQMNLMVGTTT